MRADGTRNTCPSATNTFRSSGVSSRAPGEWRNEINPAPRGRGDHASRFSLCNALPGERNEAPPCDALAL